MSFFGYEAARMKKLDAKSNLPVGSAEIKPHNGNGLLKADSVKDSGIVRAKSKHQKDQVGLQSMAMLKLRAALEEKLKQKGIFSSIAPKHRNAKRNFKPLNGQLASRDDFDDDTTDIRNREEKLSLSAALSKVATQVKKAKIVSGDDDLPKRDDIGKRRRNHELRVLAGAGIKSNDVSDDMEVEKETESESDIEFYKEVEAQHKSKLAAKSNKYSRTPADPVLPEILFDGKRRITQQMEKNRGLTRARKRLIKNPRKKYKLKHQKAVVGRKGQVRDIKKPSGPYGGETSGINAGISRSVRFKS